MATTYQSSKHDIGIVNVSTTGLGTDVIGMMLVKDPKTGAPAYAEYDSKYLAEQFFTGAPAETYQDPEEELTIAQSDWRSGFGLEIADSSDPKRYYASYGCDLRFKGQAMAGYSPTAIALPTPHTASAWNETFCNHADPSVAWDNEANAYDGNTGTFADTTLPAAGNWSGYIELYIPAISCSSVRWWWSESVNNAVGGIDIDLYYDDAWNHTYTEEAVGCAGEGAYATQAIGATKIVTALRVRFKANGGGNDAQLNSIQLYGTSATIAGSPKKGKDFNDSLYIPIANTLYKLNATGDGWTLVEAFPVNITCIEVWGNYLFIAQHTTDPYWYMDTAEACLESTAATNTFELFQTVHTTAPILWGKDSDNTVRSNTNPVNGGAAWAAATTVGSSFYEITELVTRSGALYIMKEDMPYYLDSTGAVQNDLAPELTSLMATTSGKNAVVYKNSVYIPCGTQALLETDGTINTFINPASYCTNLSDFNGTIQALAFDEEWLFAILDNSTKVEVLATREESIDGSTRRVWHPLAEITLAGAEGAFVSTEYQKRLWIISTSSANSIYYIPLPTGYGDITSDANRSFKTDTYFYTPYYHGEFKSDTKAFIKIVVTLGHTYDADIYWECWYEKLGDASWTDAGDLKGTATSRIATLYIPVDAAAAKPVSTMMRFKFVAKTDDTTKTPILLQYTVKAILYPIRRTLIACKVYASEDITLKNGQIEKNIYDTVRTTITNMRNATWPVTFYDIFYTNTTRSVKLLPLPRNTPLFEVVKSEKTREKEIIYNLLMQEVTLS